ncbi:hypothetical protein SAMN04488564_118152 [Lentzea waywayandensis]|uniref:Uncharacterized protein n=1 Tax=Lentzea waywayandensis TaxID=84724 RepID=A0A1I6FHC2_9PSEU|nr:hypothetical protein [Lentzea waywayandensis]SFR29351.1 hypothetical protein SAMN04488564_118152 [Lentzea waywayandensis]
MTTAYQDTASTIERLRVEYDDLVRRHADDNGVLPPKQAVEAAELAHLIHLEHAAEADHYRRLSHEHREGRAC